MKLQLLCIYLFGALVCWASIAAFWRTHGEHASLLAFILFALESLVRSLINHAVGRHLLSYPPPLFSPSVLLASAIVAPLFPATYALIKSAKRAVRGSGLVLLAVLAFVSLYWRHVPRDLF